MKSVEYSVIEKFDLPIVSKLHEIRERLLVENRLIITAEPGAGKSTLLPIALMNEPWVKGGKIIMLEPRRVATRSIASRVASILGESVGKRAGYRVRFDNKISSDTVIEVVTEGILTRMLQSDNALEGVAAVIFDEFHERSLIADLTLALSVESQNYLRPDLKLIVMSATLDIDLLTKLLSAPVISCSGRQFPVDIIYGEEVDRYKVAESASRVVLRALREQSGDILLFLPGEAEIVKCQKILTDSCSAVITPLYGQLSYSEQNRAILPLDSGERKVILATSIAETSLTIEGVSVVVDTGLAKEPSFNHSSGISKLETVQISLDRADQRAGRAGRLSSGYCYRMWSRATNFKLKAHRTPEILESDLSLVALELLKWGVTDPTELVWLDLPPSGGYLKGVKLLEELGAIESGKILTKGDEIHRLGCNPRVANMLISASGELAPLATDIAAIIESRDPLFNPSSIDLSLRVEALRRARSGKSGVGSFKYIGSSAEKYRKLIKCREDNSRVTPTDIGLLLTYAYPDRVAKRLGDSREYKLANGLKGEIQESDYIGNEEWIVVANLSANRGGSRLFLAAPVEFNKLSRYSREEVIVEWSSRDGVLISQKRTLIGAITVESTRLREFDEDKVAQALLKAVAQDGERLLNFTEEVKQWQNRVMSLREWTGDDSWPDVTTKSILESAGEWLLPYLSGVRKSDDFRKIDLISALHYSLSSDKQQQLSKLAPPSIKIPSGVYKKIKYSINGATPILSARVQELFGMEDTPKLLNGKVALVVHLLSPGFKPVQVTQDLKSFWSTTYYEVRKELKRRYPKHPWPDDPWSQKAISK